MMKDNTTSQPLVDFGPVEDKSKGIIKVIGVGGGGCNAVRNMYNEGIEGVTLAVCNTDSKSLAPSPVPVKIMLGEGLGAGGVPEIGKHGRRNRHGLSAGRCQRGKENGFADDRRSDHTVLF